MPLPLGPTTAVTSPAHASTLTPSRIAGPDLPFACEERGMHPSVLFDLGKSYMCAVCIQCNNTYVQWNNLKGRPWGCTWSK